MTSENKRACPYCGQSINKRQIALFSGMVEALWRVFKWCQRHGSYEFTRKDIKHLLENENQVARFGDWKYFAGIVYKPGNKRGHYGIHKERAKDFFFGREQIPTSVWKDPVTKEIEPEDYRFIYEIKHLSNFLNENQEYVAQYKDEGAEQNGLFD